MSDGRVIAEFRDYPGLLDALRARALELSVQGERFDEYAGLPRGYLSKLIGVMPVRKIGMMSMGPLFAALGITCVIIENPSATAQLKNRLKPRNNSYSRRVEPYVRIITPRQWQKIGKLGPHARWKRLNKQQRSKIMKAVRLGVKIR